MSQAIQVKPGYSVRIAKDALEIGNFGDFIKSSIDFV